MNAFIQVDNYRWYKKRLMHITQLIAAASLLLPAYAFSSSTTLLTDENQQKIELAVWKYAVDTSLLQQTIQWFRGLTKQTRESAAVAELSRLEFMQAQLERDRQHRLRLFERSVASADRALMLNPEDVRGLFWKAASMGKMAEDGGVLNALKMLRPMEELLLKVVTLDEKYENAGAHRALGRMYHKLPGFPISFGSNQKALQHLQRAHELFPRDVITRAFFAELLFDVGRTEEARRHASFVLATPIADEDALEYAEYVSIALAVVEKTGGSTLKVGNY